MLLRRSISSLLLPFSKGQKKLACQYHSVHIYVHDQCEALGLSHVHVRFIDGWRCSLSVVV